MGVRLIPPGETTPQEFPDSELKDRLSAGYRREGDAEHAARVQHEANLADVAPTESFALGGANALSGGAADAVIAGFGGEAGRRNVEAFKEAHPYWTTAGELLPLVTGVGAPGAAARGGALASGLVRGEGAIANIARGAVRYGTEGALLNVGPAVSEIATLPEDELTGERAASVLKTSMLLGLGVGGAAGTLGKVAEIGLARGKRALTDIVEAQSANNVAGDFGKMNGEQLEVAHKAEEANIAAQHETDLSALKERRAAERQSIADDLHAYQREVIESKQAITTKDLKLASEEGKLSTADIGRWSRDANRDMDRILKNRSSLIGDEARNKMGNALDALQAQDNALTRMLEREPELRAAYAGDETGARAAALDASAGLLEKNRALQERIKGVMQKLPEAPKSSATLDQIKSARNILASRPEQTEMQKIMGHTAFSAAEHALDLIPVPIPGASVAKRWVASKFADLVTGRLGKAISESAGKAAKHVDAFMAPATKVATEAPPLATKTLLATKFGPSKPEQPKNLREAFAARSEEIRSQVEAAPDGKLQMKPEARAKVAEQLAPLAAIQPKLADMVESVKAAAVAFLADKLPKKPDILGMPLGGPDRWHPSDLEMRTWARYVSAVEDPNGVFARLAKGVLLPEDIEAMQAVYPKMHQHMVQMLTMKLPELRKELPYSKRLALSIFSGVPVDPTLDPRIIAGIQQQFTTEPGSEGGTQAPRAEAKFGSLGSAKSQEKNTPAQERAG